VEVAEAVVAVAVVVDLVVDVEVEVADSEEVHQPGEVVVVVDLGVGEVQDLEVEWVVTVEALELAVQEEALEADLVGPVALGLAKGLEVAEAMEMTEVLGVAKGLELVVVEVLEALVVQQVATRVVQASVEQLVGVVETSEVDLVRVVADLVEVQVVLVLPEGTMVVETWEEQAVMQQLLMSAFLKILLVPLLARVAVESDRCERNRVPR
jgi:hypothetical protein